MTLQGWVRDVARELDVPEPDTAELLALTRDVAHTVERPAAPLTAWLVGAAVARGADAGDVVRTVRGMLADWSPP
jgi:hypothetical protein